MSRRAPACAVALVLLATGCGGASRAPAGERPAGAQRAGWTVVHDAARGFAVAFPSGWRRARRSLTPHLSDPREILSVGTGPFVVDEGRCAHMPTGALARLGPGDVLVSVLERRGGGRGDPARPRPFRLVRPDESEALACLSDPPRLRTWWRPFRDGDRAFYALVAIGLPAPAARRRQAERVLDSLRFTPRGAGGAG
jgi:hypothetical protein